jgi:hypothetical protein
MGDTQQSGSLTISSSIFVSRSPERAAHSIAPFRGAWRLEPAPRSPHPWLSRIDIGQSGLLVGEHDSAEHPGQRVKPSMATLFQYLSHSAITLVATQACSASQWLACTDLAPGGHKVYRIFATNTGEMALRQQRQALRIGMPLPHLCKGDATVHRGRGIGTDKKTLWQQTWCRDAAASDPGEECEPPVRAFHRPIARGRTQVVP